MLIAEASEQPIHSFMRRAEIPNAVSRREERVAYSASENHVTYGRLSTTFPGQMLNAVEMSVPARYVSDVIAHESEEIIFVIDGIIRYVIEGTLYELHAGDSLHFAAHRPHKVQNLTDGVAEILAVGTQQFLSGRPSRDAIHPKVRTRAERDSHPR